MERIIPLVVVGVYSVHRLNHNKRNKEERRAAKSAKVAAIAAREEVSSYFRSPTSPSYSNYRGHERYDEEDAYNQYDEEDGYDQYDEEDGYDQYDEGDSHYQNTEKYGYHEYSEDDSHEKCVNKPKLQAPQHHMSEGSREWRPVYLFERSTSKSGYNRIRTHRALLVGDWNGRAGYGRAHEIRKQKSSSLFGFFDRTMKYTDADHWVGRKGIDRPPVFLGVTDWTDQELNMQGHKMVDEYPTYSLSYANCQHFVADLAEQIIPYNRMDEVGMESVRPNLDRVLDKIGTGRPHSHTTAILDDVAGLTLGTAKNTIKFFHFTKAVLHSLLELDWRPYDEFRRFLHGENQRLIRAHSREDLRLRSTPGNRSSVSSARGSTRSSTRSSTRTRAKSSTRTSPRNSTGGLRHERPIRRW